MAWSSYIYFSETDRCYSTIADYNDITFLWNCCHFSFVWFPQAHELRVCVSVFPCIFSFLSSPFTQASMRWPNSCPETSRSVFAVSALFKMFWIWITILQEIQHLLLPLYLVCLLPLPLFLCVLTSLLSMCSVVCPFSRWAQVGICLMSCQNHIFHIWQTISIIVALWLYICLFTVSLLYTLYCMSVCLSLALLWIFPVFSTFFLFCFHFSFFLH